ADIDRGLQDQVGGAVEQQASEAPGGIALERPTFRVRRVLAQAAVRERPGVDERVVARYVEDHDRVLAAGLIEVPSSRPPAFCEAGPVHPEASDPRTAGRPLGRLVNLANEVGDGCDGSR